MIPDTTPIANATAKILVQKRASRAKCSRPVRSHRISSVAMNAASPMVKPGKTMWKLIVNANCSRASSRASKSGIRPPRGAAAIARSAGSARTSAGSSAIIASFRCGTHRTSADRRAPEAGLQSGQPHPLGMRASAIPRARHPNPLEDTMLAALRSTGAALCACAALSAAPAFAADQFVNVLTGGTSGVYYPLGVALSNTIGKQLPNVKTSVQSTKASVENLNLLQSGRGEIAFTLGDALSDAWKGNEEAGFKSPLKKLRGIAAIYPNYIQIVARADAGIKTLADLKGKKISVGAPRSGTELNARAVLAAAGITYKDFSKVEYLPFGESVELMKNRQLDVTLQSAGLGVASLRDLATSVDIVVVPIPPDVVKKFGDPAYIHAMIPAGTYKGQDKEAQTAAVQNYLVSHEGVSNETAYGMTKALWTGLDNLVAAHAGKRAS
jgi:TRAP transporter TAXI family solute receptor